MELLIIVTSIFLTFLLCTLPFIQHQHWVLRVAEVNEFIEEGKQEAHDNRENQ